MKIVNSILLFVLINQCIVLSQQPNNRGRQRIEAQKVAFITEKLDLSPQEAQAFWPIYNEYQDKKDEITSKTRETLREAMLSIDKMTNKETEIMLNEYFELQEMEAALNEEYMNRFKAVISPKKVLKLYIAEIQFKNYLLKQIRENRAKQREGRM